MDWLEVIKQVSILIGIWVAIYGIDAWRREHIGKRQLELAEDTLALFYEASDAVKYMRNPISHSHETDNIEQGDQETEAEFQARKNASVVFHRYNQYQELFNKIHASRYRFMSQIGKSESAAFYDLRNIVNEIVISARILIRLWAREHFSDAERWEKHRAQIVKHEAIFWEGLEEDDPINPKIDKVISDIEKTCKSIIAGKGSMHGFLNMKLGKRS